MKDGTIIGAIDLGSNSFRLELARVENGHFSKVDYLKEVVRQGGGLDAHRQLSAEAMQRGWECLGRFAERLRNIPKGNVRAVATQTLREARNRDVFLSQAEAILGLPINTITGKEEARLVYQGVTHLLPQSNEKRLVIDIGGRSTELVVGRGTFPIDMESFRVGCVSWSNQHFPDGKFSDKAFESATVSAKAFFEGAAQVFGPSQWEKAYGSSGTIGAIAEVLSANQRNAGVISYGDLQWLKKKLIRSDSVENLKLEGLKEDRRAVIGGGLCALIALFEVLQIEQLWAAEGALRQGVLLDILNHDLSSSNLREKSVLRLAKRFGVDAEQAERVRRASQHFYLQVQGNQAEQSLQELAWAAWLHEIGSAISHTDYHKHGAYILDNADALGFSVPELHRLGQLVLGHRGKLKKLGDTLGDAPFAKQLLAFRLGVIVSHARAPVDLTSVQLSLRTGQAHSFEFQADQKWALAHPQTVYLLEQEAMAWEKVGLRFNMVVTK